MTAPDLAELFATLDRPLTTADGVPEAEIAAAEQRLGVRLPESLRTYDHLAGKHRLNGVSNHLSRIGSLDIDRRMVRFFAENQGVEVWVFADHSVSAQFGGGGGQFEGVTIVRRTANKLGEEFLDGNKPKAPSVALYLENGSAHVVGKGMTFVGMDTTAYGAKRPLEDRQRKGKWTFIDVADPQNGANTK